MYGVEPVVCDARTANANVDVDAREVRCVGRAMTHELRPVCSAHVQNSIQSMGLSMATLPCGAQLLVDAL